MDYRKAIKLSGRGVVMKAMTFDIVALYYRIFDQGLFINIAHHI